MNKRISDYPKSEDLTESYIREYWEDYKHKSIFLDRYDEVPKQYSTDFLREMKDVFEIEYWRDLSEQDGFLTEAQIEEFKDYVDWRWISQFYELSDQFIEKWKERLPLL